MRILASSAMTWLLATLAACTVVSFDSKTLAPSGPTVKAVRTEFVAEATVPTQVTATGLINALPPVTRANVDRAQSATPQFVSIFAAGFRERFPAFAEAQGLVVTPTADTLLRVSVTGQKTYCTVSCASRILLRGEVIDAAGKTVWQFDTTVGQTTIFDSISADTFDSFAKEVLAAMKKDRVIGG